MSSRLFFIDDKVIIYTMKSLIVTPKFQLLLLLFFLIITNFASNFSFNNLIYFALMIYLAVIFDFLFLKIKKIKLYFPSAAIITGIIIAFLNLPTNSWIISTLIVFISIFSKHFLKIQGRSIFNPAAFGLFIGGLIFKIPISWWGVSTIYILYIVLTGYVSVFRSRKLYSILSFYILYQFLTFLTAKSVNFFDPVLIFFTLVMLSEPMTSPNRHIRQILFGATVAFLTLLMSYIPRSFFLPDLLIPSLLIGNLLFLKFK